MANVLNELSWGIMEYVIANFEINVNGTRTKLQKTQVKNLYIEKDYDDLMLPIFMVNISIPTDLYYEINRNHSNTTFTITINIQKRAEEGKKPTKKSVYLNDIFVPLAIDGTPFTDESTYKKIKEASSGSDGKLDIDDLNDDHTFILGKQDVVKNIKKIRNNVFTRINMTDTVAYLLSICGFSKVLMSVMDNNTMYNELILLPIPLTEQLAYLNNMFGFYREGAQIFFDFDLTYVLRNCARCTAYQQNEMRDINLVVYKSSSGKSADKGSCEHNDAGYINAGAGGQFHIEDQSKSSDTYLGNNSLIINDNTNVTQATTNESGSYNVITTTTHNSYYAEEARLRLKELEGVVTLTASNIDLRYLAPNKNYKILSDDSAVSKQVNAPFRLSKYQVVFATEGDALSPVATIVLKKTEA